MDNSSNINHFRSSFGKCYPQSCNFTQIFSTCEKMKLFFRTVRGYDLFYILDGKNVMSYCFLKKNYLFKYSFLSKDDRLINPYYTLPQYRSHGLASKMINYISNTNEWNNIFAVVEKANNTSRKILESNGFKIIGYCSKSTWKLKVCSQISNLMVYKYEGEGKEK